MKRLLYIIICMLALAGCSREAEELPLYRRLAARPDLTVAQVKGFAIGDTLRTDVVIIVADDSAAWQRLKAEFDIRPSQGVTSWLGDLEQPARRVKRSAMPLWRAMALHADRTLALYRVDSPAHFDALRNYQLHQQTQ